MHTIPIDIGNVVRPEPERACTIHRSEGAGACVSGPAGAARTRLDLSRRLRRWPGLRCAPAFAVPRRLVGARWRRGSCGVAAAIPRPSLRRICAKHEPARRAGARRADGNRGCRHDAAGLPGGERSRRRRQSPGRSRTPRGPRCRRGGVAGCRGRRAGGTIRAISTSGAPGYFDLLLGTDDRGGCSGRR